ncbi:LADA_0H02212g1_1 [Lachancea dasiensis]|uniref:Topoisomerase 1-associated factor 1 n=1 Tax=Lachancea dasiensis TaxID=1072105 RepID=A0A1G4JZM5_9SACH|nr:LADA_0H02212g1_1 [Lachancea dasiensis]
MSNKASTRLEAEESTEGPEVPTKHDTQALDHSSKILRARIALLSTAIGGPDHSSNLDPPPYQIGDDCLACLKDLKRWFKLVDERQSRWDVAVAAAQYNIFTDDLVPIMLNWENRYAQAAKSARKVGGKVEEHLSAKVYHDKIALNALQLMVLMTWPLILTDQSTQNQVECYSQLKKSQVIYKKSVLSSHNGKVLKAAVRLAVEVIKVEKRFRSAKDNAVLRLVLNFLRNIAAIEPSDLTLSNKKSLSKGINSTNMLPPNISKQDISLAAVVDAFGKNKVFGLILTLSRSINQDFDAAFINVPLLELTFFLVKNVNHSVLFDIDLRKKDRVEGEGTGQLSRTGRQLSELLKKEHDMRKNVTKNTSTRHSRFGTMLSIQTPDQNRLTVSGAQNLLNDDSALKKMDSRKKWNKRTVSANETVEGLPSNFMTFDLETNYWEKETTKTFKQFIHEFTIIGFNPLFQSVTDNFTTEDDKMLVVHQIQYLLVYAWFLKYYRTSEGHFTDVGFEPFSALIRETALILIGQLLRKAVENKIWAIVHAGMIAFSELLSLLESFNDGESDRKERAEYLVFQEERLKLFSSLPRTASNHSLSYIRSCISLLHVLFKLLESKRIRSETEDGDFGQNLNASTEEAKRIAEEEGIELEEAIEILERASFRSNLNFNKVQKAFTNEDTVKTYITFLQNFRELTDDDIKKPIQFLYKILMSHGDEILLFRIDFFILLQKMLGPTGLPTLSRPRRHVTRFADALMMKFKERLRSSPSWFVGILFPTIHEREAGYYQRHGTVLDLKDTEKVSQASEFYPIPGAEASGEGFVLDFKFGVLVSTLIDKEKETCVESLRDNLQRSIEIFKSWLLKEVASNNEFDHQVRESFQTPSPVVERAVNRDPDFRALLKLCGYDLNQKFKQPCFLRTTIISDLETCADLITKYLVNPFDTPSGESPSRYLKRPGQLDSAGDSEIYDLDEEREGMVRDVSQQEDDYFRSLTKPQIDEQPQASAHKGIALTKKKGTLTKRRAKKTRARDNNDPKGSTTDDPTAAFKSQKVTSAEFISDSDESDEEGLRSNFYENEMYMRFLLDKYGGSLPDHKFAQFAAFSAERIQNNGKLVKDYTDLFGGPVPTLSELNANEATTVSLPPKHAGTVFSSNEISSTSQSLNQDILLSNSETEGIDSFQSPTISKKTRERESSSDEEDDDDVGLSRKRRMVRINKTDDDDDDDE